MIDAFIDFFRVCYENTGLPLGRIDIDQRVYDKLVLEVQKRSTTPCPNFYPGYILLDGVLIYARL